MGKRADRKERSRVLREEYKAQIRKKAHEFGGGIKGASKLDGFLFKLRRDHLKDAPMIDGAVRDLIAEGYAQRDKSRVHIKELITKEVGAEAVTDDIVNMTYDALVNEQLNSTQGTKHKP